MKAIPQGWTIVLVGYWNRMLLTPDWVATNLFEQDTIDVAFPVMPLNPLMFTAGKVRFTPADERATISLEVVEDDAWGKAEHIALSLLAKLPHTPVRAFGVNLRFSESVPDPAQLSLFNFVDLPALTDFGCEVQSALVQRTLKVRDDLVLNLKITHGQSGLDYDFNFHFEVKNADEARVNLKGKTAKCKEVALVLMKDAYGLTLDVGES
jgi:hypothetical protein